MAYMTIGKNHVFITPSRLQRLREEALKDQTASFRMLSLGSSKAAAKAEDLIYAYLCRLQQENPQKFTKEWVEFNLSNEDASENVVDLLYDYCYLHGQSYLSEVREDQGGYPSMHIASDDPPISKIFALNHWIQPRRWWRRFLKPNGGREISIFIDREVVFRLMGTLDNFALLGDRMCIRCARHISLYSGHLQPENVTSNIPCSFISSARDLKAIGHKKAWRSGGLWFTYFAVYGLGAFLLPSILRSFDWGWLQGMFTGKDLDGHLYLHANWFGSISLSSTFLLFLYALCMTSLGVLLGWYEQQKK